MALMMIGSGINRLHSNLTKCRFGLSTFPRSSHGVHAHKSDFDYFSDYVLNTQSAILEDAAALDGSGKQFITDQWARDSTNINAGYGLTAVLEDGLILEKAAANVSIIQGVLTPARAHSMTSRGRSGIDPNGGQSYKAAALSLVFHSAHPLIPTLRADVRFFQVDEQMWMGGGCDLTPAYLHEPSITQFHLYWKNMCDRYGTHLYHQMKEECDRYFYIPARKEHRGTGGIFYDDLSSEESGFNVSAFTEEVGSGFLPSWLPSVEALRSLPYTEEQRQWQLLRRGRYLEFNLLYDRGVKFGLDGGRMESIMVSAPPLIAWRYNVQAKPESDEEKLVQVLQKPRSWL
ncbi:hypothetical protein CEUSTIGMA_g4775.t1 [Chlamydomonas eustigma]|uniref:Uncharacterized protein n=1 Tax=Chlamydomonas eustigma TaxID=1157962 RepID=A0A250X315_9CHLO|nr:hypothetical protein CEUSTIGMA_g4775.t1 [Chlamydomonas eustigma]|eukprot:GAX77329.1 hypothetical protein CEUSTIGMA_g4775.t1 [Chlamydomonas eustigma]